MRMRREDIHAVDVALRCREGTKKLTLILTWIIIGSVSFD